MFNLRLCNATTIRYCLLKFGHIHLCGIDCKEFLLHCCGCTGFGCTAAIRYGSTCHGPHSESVHLGNEHKEFNWPRSVKCEAGFPNPGGLLIGPNQLWCVNDSPHCRELSIFHISNKLCTCVIRFCFDANHLYRHPSYAIENASHITGPLCWDWTGVFPSQGKWSGPRLNIKTVLSTYGDFHVKDKTAVRTSYL